MIFNSLTFLVFVFAVFRLDWLLELGRKAAIGTTASFQAFERRTP